MSIYIKNMDIPADNPARVVINPNGQVFVDHSTWYSEYEAVQVPPHGRLIEKNAVFELIRSFPNVDRQLPAEFMKALYELPTIIPESEEADNETND